MVNLAKRPLYGPLCSNARENGGDSKPQVSTHLMEARRDQWLYEVGMVQTLISAMTTYTHKDLLSVQERLRHGLRCDQVLGKPQADR